MGQVVIQIVSNWNLFKTCPNIIVTSLTLIGLHRAVQFLVFKAIICHTWLSLTCVNVPLKAGLSAVLLPATRTNVPIGTIGFILILKDTK